MRFFRFLVLFLIIDGAGCFQPPSLSHLGRGCGHIGGRCGLKRKDPLFVMYKERVGGGGGMEERAGTEPTPSPETRILAIAAPALASLCLDPLMSAADTVVVGQLASTSELGGLAVATTVITVSFCDFNFLSTSTAPFVASARAGGDAEGASKLAGTAMTSACIIGLALAAGLYLFAAPVATIVAGPGGDAGVLAAAEGIVRIRALAAPAALLVSASNGAFRGMLDTKTPFKIVLGANAMNLALDALLVPSFGAEGAAAATTFAEFAAAAACCNLLARASPPIMLQPPSLPSSSGGVATASLLVFALTMALQITIAAATACVARSDDAAALASHQIASQLLMLASFSADSLAVASQVLVASASPSQAPGEVTLTDAARLVSASALRLGALFGAAAGCLLWIARGAAASLFTSDPSVAAQAKWAVGAVALLLPLACVVYVGDGVMQGARAFKYESGAMTAACVLSLAALLAGAGPAVMHLTGCGALGDDAGGLLDDGADSKALVQAWGGIYALFVGRAAAFAGWWATRRKDGSQGRGAGGG